MKRYERRFVLFVPIVMSTSSLFYQLTVRDDGDGTDFVTSVQTAMSAKYGIREFYAPYWGPFGTTELTKYIIGG